MKLEDIFYKQSTGTVIACSNTHGIIPVVNARSDNGICDDYFIQHRLPEHMNIIKITATVLGVANISTLENLNEINDAIKRYSKKINKKNGKPLIEIAKQIRDEIRTINKKHAGKIINVGDDLTDEDKLHYDAYRHYMDDMFRIEVIRGGDLYNEKKFIQFTENEQFDFGAADNKYVNKILLMEKGVVNFFEIYGYGDMTKVSQSSFFQWLEEYNINSAIFVDLSCSVTTADSRTNRKLKRRLNSQL